MHALNVVYDLRVLPSTFDFPYFLAIADARRRLETSAEVINLWLVTGKSRRPQEWDWTSDLSKSDLSQLINSRLNRIIFPVASLFESVKTINVIDESVVNDLPLAVFHPEGYSFRAPVLGVYHKGWHCLAYASKIDMRTLKNSESSLAQARRYLLAKVGSTAPVILTTRNNVYSHDQTRNSRRDLLRKLIVTLRELGFVVGIVPDTSLTGVLEMEFPEALLVAPSFDVQLRSAIYECAAMCLFEPTGPLVLAQLNKRVKFIAYGIAWSDKFSAEYQLQRGYRRDVNFIAPDSDTQLYLWGDLDIDYLRQWVNQNLRVKA